MANFSVPFMRASSARARSAGGCCRSIHGRVGSIVAVAVAPPVAAAVVAEREESSITLARPRLLVVVLRILFCVGLRLCFGGCCGRKRKVRTIGLSSLTWLPATGFFLLLELARALYDVFRPCAETFFVCLAFASAAPGEK
eukprot:TRINITY_DN10700_c0_g1_i1.p2 TRINITY_DN10700_c0_g1~~TRINITY_DN10700_c0_g1_i1.p2  ORF type:complete len:141 (+),score=7.10 TRINITY_DN10700_c0_g1_i1:88-510(+)